MDGKLHWIAYFRSWNLWSGFPGELGGAAAGQGNYGNGNGCGGRRDRSDIERLNIRDYNIEVALMRLQRETGVRLGARIE